MISKPGNMIAFVASSGVRQYDKILWLAFFVAMMIAGLAPMGAHAQRAPGGTVPLILYWSAQRGDNFTTATSGGQRDAQAAGYAFVRVEGYVYRRQVPGTVPLMLYWSAERGDNFTTATSDGQNDALAAGYAFVRVEGYVFRAQ